MIDVSIIIVSWNVAELLAACIESIVAAPVAINEAQSDLPLVDIIVVDSASSDETVSMLQEQFPQVKLLAQDTNVGFTRGNNIGMAAAQGRHLFLLNPDTVIHGDAIGVMLRYLDDNPNVGIVGPHTLNTDGTTQSSRRRFPSPTLAFFESTWLESIAPKQMLNDYYVTAPPDDALVDVDWVQGSALIARREVYEQIGGLDIAFTMFFEELDWCKRAKDAGWRVVYVGTAQITHHGGKSTEQVKAHKHIYFQESKLRYFRKHHSRTVADMLRVHLMSQYVWQIGIEGTKGLIGSKREMRRERVKTYWQVLRSGLKGD